MAAASNIEEIPETGPRSAVAQAEIDHLLTGGGQAPMARRSDDSLAVSVQATAGPGGIGVDYTPEVGINARQARTDSLNVQLRSARFLRTQVGGVPAVSTSAIVSSIPRSADTDSATWRASPVIMATSTPSWCS